MNGKAKSAQAKNIRERIGAILAGCLFVAVGSCSKAGANTGPGKTGTAATGQSACDRKLLTADDVGGILSDPVVGTKDLKGDPQTCYFLTRTSESAGGPELMITLRPGLGRATIETYTVVHSRDGYRMGIVIGRDARGRRFVANTPRDEATLKAMESEEQIGGHGSVRRADDGVHNLFVPG